ncbi:GNAT family N-acetyltransferase [Facklamia sp. DSM 111018]|uniref:GNAT family N-acetyltransferase n=1 Tax=Facklamia lactis TaxID=2749967 RepID=A0ABS0LUG9_9LACT|nr:GNAT family N-acetyltransferase [Facklamia lactis]MBG9987016.1 GNAT family N-acetyltransferase [Facklamia lactis]
MQIVKYDKKYNEQFKAYQFEDDTFASHPSVLLERYKNKANIEIFIGLNEKGMVAFGILDFSQNRLVYTDQQNTVLIRGLSVDEKQRGNGYSRQLMNFFIDYIQQKKPEIIEIVLAVETENEVGKQLYRSLNFIDSGRRLMGRSGEQQAWYLKVGNEG